MLRNIRACFFSFLRQDCNQGLIINMFVSIKTELRKCGNEFRVPLTASFRVLLLGLGCDFNTEGHIFSLGVKDW